MEGWFNHAVVILYINANVGCGPSVRNLFKSITRFTIKADHEKDQNCCWCLLFGACNELKGVGRDFLISWTLKFCPSRYYKNC